MSPAGRGRPSVPHPGSVVRGVRHRLGVAFHDRVRAIAAAEIERRSATAGAADQAATTASAGAPPAHPVGAAAAPAAPPPTTDDVWRIAKAQAETTLADAQSHPPRGPAVFGPDTRLHLAPRTVVNDALFNTVSGEIHVAETAFFGHGVAVLTGTHDHRATGMARQLAVPDAGNDVVIGEGAWIGSRATIVGPARIGAHAVVAANAVVTADVGIGEIVAGVPARRIGSVVPPPDRPVLDVATDVGRMFVHEHDEFITPCLVEHGRMLDDDLAMVRDRRPGATVVDVGANIGYSTLALSAAVGDTGTVIAVEPHPANVELLRANVKRNGAANVRIVAAAAMPTAGDGVLAEAPHNTGDHRMSTAEAGAAGVTTGGEDRRAVAVRSVTLDDELRDLDRVELLLLDTQGTEHRALEGASATLQRHRPTVFVEFWPQGIRSFGDDPAEVLAFYRGLDYERTLVEDESLDTGDDEALLAAVDARPGASGGFATLLLRPRG